MTSKIGVAVMSVLLLIYLGAVMGLALALIRSGDAVAIGMGVALLVMPLLGAWALVAELVFGMRAGRLTRKLDAEGELPLDTLPKRTSGRPDRAAADVEFPHFRDEAKRTPGDWRSWFRLGLAYDASGDRRRARGAIRQAIALEKAEAKGA